MEDSYEPTASTSTRTMIFSKDKEEVVSFVNEHLKNWDGTSASITITYQEKSGVYFAISATSLWSDDTEKLID